jgi:hypothetical protein
MSVISPSYEADFAHFLPTMYQTVYLQMLTQKMQETKSDWYAPFLSFVEGANIAVALSMSLPVYLMWKLTEEQQ